MSTMSETTTGRQNGGQQEGTFRDTAAERPVAVFVLALISGLLILAASAMLVAFFPFGPYHSYGQGYYGMMGSFYGGYYGMMGAGYYDAGLPYIMGAVGLVSGAVILVGAVMAYSDPGRAAAWSIVILVFSLASLFAMGGFLVGAIFGAVGGVVGLVWRPAGSPRSA